jgi:endonuclease-3
MLVNLYDGQAEGIHIRRIPDDDGALRSRRAGFLRENRKGRIRHGYNDRGDHNPFHSILPNSPNQYRTLSVSAQAEGPAKKVLSGGRLAQGVRNLHNLRHGKIPGSVGTDAAIVRILVERWPAANRFCISRMFRTPGRGQCCRPRPRNEQVNRVTPELFRRWPSPAALAAAQVEEVEDIIHSVGFFRTKARHLVLLAGIVAERYGGRIPETMEGLLELPGVGRKTANLVASACFGRPGIIADTHFLRVCDRLGLIEGRDPLAAERKIEALVPPEDRTAFSHAANRLGKYVCIARRPACPECPVTRPLVPPRGRD